MSTELANVDTTPTYLANLDEKMSYAKAIAAAGIVPQAFRNNPPDILIAMGVADEIGETPFTVMQEMAVIGGRPSFSAKFMRSRVRQAGHRLRESFEGGVARCVIIRADDPDFEHRATWDEAKARQHGLWGKGHWAKNPELMLANRALSECVREACYEVMGGVAYTPDEVADFAEPQPTRISKERPAPRVSYGALIDAARAAGAQPDDMCAIATELLGRQITAASDMTQDEVDQVAARLVEIAGSAPVEAEVIDAETGEVQPALDDQEGR